MHGPPVRRHALTLAPHIPVNDTITWNGVRQNTHRTAQIRGAVLERLACPDVAFVAPRRRRKDLQQPVPSAAPANRPWPIRAFMFGKARHKADPKRPPVCIGCGFVCRTPRFNVSGNQLNQWLTVCLERRQCGTCPNGMPLHMLPTRPRERSSPRWRSEPRFEHNIRPVLPNFNRPRRNQRVARSNGFRHVCRTCFGPQKPSMRALREYCCAADKPKNAHTYKGSFQLHRVIMAHLS